MANPLRILVRSPNWIGDQVLSYPFFYFLRQAFVGSKIAVSCVPWVSAIQFRNLVDEVYPLTQSAHSSFWTKWQALEKAAAHLRDQGSWDLGITLPNSFSSAWLLYRAKAGRRRGYAMDGRGFLLNESIPWKGFPVQHRSEAYVDLLRGVSGVPGFRGFAIPREWGTQFWGAHSLNPLDPPVAGVLSEFDAEQAWPDADPLEPPQGHYWVLAPGSTAESRRWPVEQFMALARKIAFETGYPGVIVGGVAESSVAESLVQDPALGLTNWTGQGVVSAYWKIFRNAQFTVSNDSGLAHVASLCGSPVHVVWGGGNPKKTEPIGPGRMQMTLNPIECWPCERNICTRSPPQWLACLKGISADGVWKEIQAGITTRRSHSK